MTAEEVLLALGEETLLEEIACCWEEAMAVLPAGNLPFLEPEQIITCRQWSGLEEALDTDLLDVAARISADPYLRRLAWYYYHRIFEGSPSGLKSLPGLEKPLGEGGGLFFLLIALAMVPRLRDYHRVLCIPEEITRETVGQIACIHNNYRRAHQGRPGVFINQLLWLRNYIKGNIYLRLGRLEYWLSPFRGGVIVYRHRTSGRVTALAEAGQRFSRSGYLNGEVSIPDDPTAWVSTLSLTEREVRGCPVRPQGFGCSQEVVLPLSEWEPVLRRGDWVLDIHIPAGGGMSLESCRDSLELAAEFYIGRFPERRPAAFTSASWIFSPQLDELLPAEANLVRFQRELYLYPMPSVSRNIWFLFPQDTFNPATAPRDTSLRRVIGDYLAAGNYWHNQGMFFLLDDLPKFGSQVYRY